MVSSAQMADERTLFKVADLTKRWSLSRSKLYQMFDSGEIKAIKIGASKRVTIDEVRKFEASLGTGSQA